VIRFRVTCQDDDVTAEGWHFMSLTARRPGQEPVHVSSLILPPDLAAELVRQVVLMNDVLDVEMAADIGLELGT
jgi:hypothetical protein